MSTLHAVQNESALSFDDGVFPSQVFKKLQSMGLLRSDAPLEEGQIQPASMDLRLSDKAYRVRAGFLPGDGHTVMERMEELKMHEVDISESGVLEKGAVYIIPLMESLSLPKGVHGLASPKSTTGRLDILTRLICDNGTSFDQVPEGYEGRLYVEVSPITFSIIAHQGDKLNQLRLRKGVSVLSDESLVALDQQGALVYNNDQQPEKPMFCEGVWLSVDLEGKNGSNIVGYRARKNAPLVDLRNIAHYEIEEFWEPIFKPTSGRIILNPEDFYILASRECLRVPAEYSAEMMAYETQAGELRVHYAGFFDPGFGCDVGGEGGFGTTGVLEIRSHDVPFVLEHGQRICRMVYEKLSETPEKIYSQNIGSNYAGQTLKLAKQFKM
ncbi:MAG: 2'-deoxycytidine 5'-triphosphate deaminase [Magnetococcales bacterium]|nr:2'-deoxycytidine 5'-triphosphate deaminase [Magnetococcales bacterium]|tara:strand:+ start:22781 stop:23929 length:1149 start_codon:yes stop_codon:yes gene_type:complete